MKTQEQLAEHLGVSPRWLPESNDAEKIAEWVERGRCHIEHRGHKNAPLLVFEDGGIMELPTVRWAQTSRGWCLVSVDKTHSAQKTTHSDVCGTIDRIKAAMKDEPNWEGLHELLDDIEHMIRRMDRRREEYDGFVADLQSILSRAVRRKPVAPAFDWLEKLREELSQDPATVRSNRAAINETAESVRDVAQFLEYALEDYRAMAQELDERVRRIKGARTWADPHGSGD
jgi:hypothetical protein